MADRIRVDTEQMEEIRSRLMELASDLSSLSAQISRVDIDRESGSEVKMQLSAPYFPFVGRSAYGGKALECLESLARMAREIGTQTRSLAGAVGVAADEMERTEREIQWRFEGQDRGESSLFKAICGALGIAADVSGWTQGAYDRFMEVVSAGNVLVEDGLALVTGKGKYSLVTSNGLIAQLTEKGSVQLAAQGTLNHEISPNGTVGKSQVMPEVIKAGAKIGGAAVEGKGNSWMNLGLSVSFFGVDLNLDLTGEGNTLRLDHDLDVKIRDTTVLDIGGEAKLEVDDNGLNLDFVSTGAVLGQSLYAVDADASIGVENGSPYIDAYAKVEAFGETQVDAGGSVSALYQDGKLDLNVQGRYNGVEANIDSTVGYRDGGWDVDVDASANGTYNGVNFDATGTLDYSDGRLSAGVDATGEYNGVKYDATASADYSDGRLSAGVDAHATGEYNGMKYDATASADYSDGKLSAGVDAHASYDALGIDLDGRLKAGIQNGVAEYEIGANVQMGENAAGGVVEGKATYEVIDLSDSIPTFDPIEYRNKVLEANTFTGTVGLPDVITRTESGMIYFQLPLRA